MASTGKRALITGITGQDGAYLAKLLLEKGYEVHGIYRSDSPRLWRLRELRIDQQVNCFRLDLSDTAQLSSVLADLVPDEIYNLGAQSSVAVSFEHPVETCEATGLAVARLLEAIRKHSPASRFFQASSSELYGRPTGQSKFSETTPFRPQNPYASAKLFAHWLTVNYREAYDVFACCGILFSHESPLRGEEFVTRKITRGLASLALDHTDEPIRLGNIESHRDWGYAGDYVMAMWEMLQQQQPEDYVLATGVGHSIREFAEAAAQFSDFELAWQRDRETEIGFDKLTGKPLIVSCSTQMRRIETACLLGDAEKARRQLGWNASTSFSQLVNNMVDADLNRLRNLSARP